MQASHSRAKVHTKQEQLSQEHTKAQVKTVTPDAMNSGKRGAIFPALLILKTSTLNMDGKRVNLAPGMNLSAEIKTGQRRIISYLFNPVHKALDESLGER